MSGSIKIAMVQENFLVGDIVGNADLVIEHALAAKENGAHLVIFPELALVGYPPEDLLHRQGFVLQVMNELERIKASISGVDIVLGMPYEDNKNLYNAAIWLRDGAEVARYYKKELPNYSVFDEKRYFSPGSETAVVEINNCKLGVVICEDAWVSQPVADAKTSGAEAVVVINASPFHIGKHNERNHVLKQRVVENNLPLIYLNMVGGQDELVFDGDSIVVSTSGEVVHRLKTFESEVGYVTFSNTEFRVEDANTKTLSDIEGIYNAVVLSVKDFVRKNGFESVVIGLSGGVDSALTLAVAVDALGADNVRAVMMPSRYTADMSLQDAEEEAGLLGIHYDVIPIENTFTAFLDSLDDVFKNTSVDTTEENIQARCRGLMLMAISNKTGSMVLTTGNKSEMAVGYATLYGDMCGGFAPLKDVSKTLVYELCHYRNSKNTVIPERVLTRAPSAELRHDQTDQDSLPDYGLLDRVLEMSVEKDMPVDAIVESGIDKDVVEQILQMVQRNEYKRRQAAPGVRITKRAFGRDRRYPITSGHRRK